MSEDAKTTLVDALEALGRAVGRGVSNGRSTATLPQPAFVQFAPAALEDKRVSMTEGVMFGVDAFGIQADGGCFVRVEMEKPQHEPGACLPGQCDRKAREDARRSVFPFGAETVAKAKALEDQALKEARFAELANGLLGQVRKSAFATIDRYTERIAPQNLKAEYEKSTTPDRPGGLLENMRRKHREISDRDGGLFGGSDRAFTRAEVIRLIDSQMSMATAKDSPHGALLTLKSFIASAE